MGGQSRDHPGPRIGPEIEHTRFGFGKVGHGGKSSWLWLLRWWEMIHFNWRINGLKRFPARPTPGSSGPTDPPARETEGLPRLPHRREREPRDRARPPGLREGLTGLPAGEPDHLAGEPDDPSRDADDPESERGERSGEPDGLAGGPGGAIPVPIF